MDAKAHWQNVYLNKATTEVSWFQEQATLSLSLIEGAKLAADAAIIDVGGGASTLVDGLLAQQYSNISVLDLSAAALATAKCRIGSRATAVQWLEADILCANLPNDNYAIWHDRAVFHFLNTAEQRQAYVHAATRALKLDGLLIIATFAEDGPTQCSGLPITRYNASSLHAEFGERFELISQHLESHYTPAGNEQKFIYCVLRKIAA